MGDECWSTDSGREVVSKERAHLDTWLKDVAPIHSRSERSERLARWSIVDEEGRSMAQPASLHAGSHIAIETTARAICCVGPDAAKRRRT